MEMQLMVFSMNATLWGWHGQEWIRGCSQKILNWHKRTNLILLKVTMLRLRLMMLMMMMMLSWGGSKEFQGEKFVPGEGSSWCRAGERMGRRVSRWTSARVWNAVKMEWPAWDPCRSKIQKLLLPLGRARSGGRENAFGPLCCRPGGSSPSPLGRIGTPGESGGATQCQWTESHPGAT